MNETDKPKRKTIRLKEYDYSQNGYYFITLCTYERKRILSDISRRGGVLLRPCGRIAEEEIIALTERYGIEIDQYVIMPDHIHLILRIKNPEIRAEQSPAPTVLKQDKPSVKDMMCAFKSLTTKRVNKHDNCQGRKLWQRSYFEHIIRNEDDYLETKNYIIENPRRWVDNIIKENGGN